jgi:NADH-quinone oxidoreductase subunit J
MDAKTALFFIFAAVTVFAALRVVTTRNAVHAALYLVLAFISCSAIWLLLEAEFLAITLVLVYVGAVMVLFLFVVMMLDVNIDKLREGFWKNLPVAGFVGVVIIIEFSLVIWHLFANVKSTDVPSAGNVDNTKALGKLLYTDYVYPFELAAVLLLVAIIAAIALTMRARKDSKSQDPSQQVRVKRNDRLRIVKVVSEKKER